jgi:hypothetical protein
MSLLNRQEAKESNPYSAKTQTTEGVLLAGECDRKIERLESLKYKLIQKQSSGQVYMENLSKKHLGLREDRTGVIADIDNIPAFKRRIFQNPGTITHQDIKAVNLKPSDLQINTDFEVESDATPGGSMT